MFGLEKRKTRLAHTWRRFTSQKPTSPKNSLWPGWAGSDSSKVFLRKFQGSEGHSLRGGLNRASGWQPAELARELTCSPFSKLEANAISDTSLSSPQAPRWVGAGSHVTPVQGCSALRRVSPAPAGPSLSRSETGLNHLLLLAVHHTPPQSSHMPFIEVSAFAPGSK